MAKNKLFREFLTHASGNFLVTSYKRTWGVPEAGENQPEGQKSEKADSPRFVKPFFKKVQSSR